MSEKLFKLSDRTINLLKIFQFCGFVPFKLCSKDCFIIIYNVPVIFIASFVIFTVVLTQIDVFPFNMDSLEQSAMILQLCFYYPYLGFSWVRVRLSKMNFTEVLSSIAGIDRMFENSLKYHGKLTQENQKTFCIIISSITFTFVFYTIDPLTNYNNPTKFIFLLYKFIPFTLCTLRIFQICFFYYMISEKLISINSRLDDIINFYHIDRHIFDTPRITDLETIGRFPELEAKSVDRLKNDMIIEKLIVLKDIYQKCWKCYNQIEQFSSLSVLLFFILLILELQIMKVTQIEEYLRIKSMEKLLSKFKILNCFQNFGLI